MKPNRGLFRVVVAAVRRDMAASAWPGIGAGIVAGKAAAGVGVASLVLLLVSCTTSPEPPQQVSIVQIMTEDVGSPHLWRKSDLVARYGDPLRVEKRGESMQYEILTYVPPGQKGRAYVLFRGEKFLTCVDENSVNMLANVIREDERAQRHRLVLLERPFQGRYLEYSIGKEHLGLLPKWDSRSGGAPPVPEAQAQALASTWRRRYWRELAGEPVVQRLVDFPCCPGLSGYLVRLGTFPLEPPELDEVIVLMDESIVPGELVTERASASTQTETTPSQTEASEPARARPHSTGRTNVTRVMIEGRNTYFLVELQKLKPYMKQSHPRTIPLSPAGAERLAREWLRRTAPRVTGKPKVSNLPNEPGLAKTYYHVDMGVAEGPLRLQEILVLMDGTIVESELK